MYEIKHNNTTLYYPGDEKCCVSSAKLEVGVGECGEFNFTIPPINPLFDIISERQVITIFNEEKEYWRGDIREVSTNFRNLKSVYCLEDLAWLGEVNKYAHMITATYAQYFADLINEYNSRVNPEKRFRVGIILKNPQELKTFKFETMSFLEILRAIADDFYVKVRRVNGEHYIDIVDLKNYTAGNISNQPIQFGDNMMDFVKESNTSWLLSAILPVGAELDTSIIEDIPDRVTIESVNQGSRVLVNQTAVAQYGYIEKVVEFGEATTPSDLKQLAENYLQKNSQPRLTMEIQAVDLSTISETDSYEIGDLIPIICRPFGIDQNVSLCNLEIDLLDPSKNKLTLSSAVERRTFTSMQNKISAEVEKTASKSEILNATKRNSSAMLNAQGDNGHVVFSQNADGVIYEILFMDTTDINTATKIWRYNGAGWGVADSKDANGEWEYKMAATIDAGFVADFITAGTLTGIHINNGNGTFDVDENGNLKATNANIKGTVTGSTITGSTTMVMKAGGSKHDTELNWGSTWGDSLTVVTNTNKDGGLGVCQKNHKEDRAVYIHYNDIRLYDDDYNPDYAQWGSSSSSDKRLKKNIKKVNKKSVRELFKRIRFVSFKYKNEESDITEHGMIAQEVEPLIEQLGFDKRAFIKKGSDGFYKLTYPNFERLGMIAIQDMYELLEHQKIEIEELKKGLKS